MRLRARVLVGAALLSPLAAAGACGEPIGEDASPGVSADASAAHEAATDVAPGADVFVDAGTCDPSKPFGRPVRVRGIPKGASCMRLSQDEQLAFYTIDRDSFVATRTPDGFLQTSILAVEGGAAQCPTFSADRRTLFHEIDFAVWRQRGTPGGRYENKVVVQPLAADGGSLTGGYLALPFFDEPRHELYVTYGYLGGDFGKKWRIAVAPVTDAGAVGRFRYVDLRGERDQRPVISADGLRIYFESPGPDAADAADPFAETDIYVATRPHVSASFGEPVRLPDVSGPGRDMPTWISPDDCRLYIAAWQTSPPVLADPTEMYVATRGL